MLLRRNRIAPWQVILHREIKCSMLLPSWTIWSYSNSFYSSAHTRNYEVGVSANFLAILSGQRTQRSHVTSFTYFKLWNRDLFWLFLLYNILLKWVQNTSIRLQLIILSYKLWHSMTSTAVVVKPSPSQRGYISVPCVSGLPDSQ